jgi:alpha-glucan, water dikinase
VCNQTEISFSNVNKTIYNTYHEPGSGAAAWRGVTKVWASQYSSRARRALAAAGADAAALQMAVLVQPVIAAQYAWVAHTRHPVTGGRFRFRFRVVRI